MNIMHANRKCLVVVDFEEEKNFWSACYQQLPGAALHPSFEMYWPLLALIYSAYVNRPGCTRDGAFQAFDASPLLRSRSLNQQARCYLFDRVWARIQGETRTITS